MNKVDLSSYQNSKWVIGVSGGPDSMALLDMAFKSGIECYVVHVNYQKRETAIRDQKIVEEFCKEHLIDCFVYDAPDFVKGNFQKNARDFRYQKMIEVLNEKQADAIVVAHHKDDDLETYLFQKTRKSKVDIFGLTKEMMFKNVLLIRPLLVYSKEELLHYCEKEHLSYGIDESNESEQYSRNRLRKQLAIMSDEEKETLYIEKEQLNLEKEKYLRENLKRLNENTIEIRDFNLIENKDRFLLEWLKYHKVNKAISNSFITELIRQISDVDSFEMPVGQLRVVKQYETVTLLSKETKSFSYIVDHIENIEFKEFTLIFTNNAKNHIKISDFPLTIKSCEGNEMVGSSRINRWFIKHKIPLQKRELWPVIYNTNGKLLYIANSSFVRGANANKITLTVVK